MQSDDRLNLLPVAVLIVDAFAVIELDELLSFVQAEGRICPLPEHWDRLWKLLPDRRQVGVTWSPATPLILAAWWASSDQQKMDRLKVHLTYASEKGVLPAVGDFLRALSPSDWHYRK